MEPPWSWNSSTYGSRENGVLFMRIEWELEGFLIPRDKIKEYVSTLFKQRFEMEFSIFFSEGFFTIL